MLTDRGGRANVAAVRGNGRGPGRRSGLGRVLDGVVGGLLGDVDVVGVALGHAGAGHAAEAGVLAEVLDVFGAAVAHAGAEAADHLVDEVAERAAVGDAAL